MTLAQTSDPIEDIFGKVTPPGPPILHGDPTVALGRVFEVGLNLIFLVAGVTVLIYMLWGAYEWITSGGDKESIEKARLRMIHAFWGLIILIVVLTVFGIISGNILGVIRLTPTGWKFRIPVVQPAPSGACPGTCRQDCRAGEKEQYGTNCDTQRCGGLGCVCCVR